MLKWTKTLLENKRRHCFFSLDLTSSFVPTRVVLCSVQSVTVTLHSGKCLQKNYGQIHQFSWENQLHMAVFNSKLLVCQRVTTYTFGGQLVNITLISPGLWCIYIYIYIYVYLYQLSHCVKEYLFAAALLAH